MYKFEFKDYTRQKYKYIGEFYEGLADVVNNAGLTGYIDKTGREVIPCQYKEGYSFSDGLAPVKIDQKYGYIDRTGTLVIPATFDNAFNFSDGYAVVMLNDKKYVYIDKRGAIISKEYLSAEPFEDGLGIVQTERGKAYFDGNREIFVDDKILEPFSEGIAITSTDETYRLRNKNMNVQGAFDDPDIFAIYDRSCGMNRVLRNGKIGYFDEHFNLTIPCIYASGSNFYDDVAIVSLDSNITDIISKDGTVLAFLKNTQYCLISDFSDGLSCVQSSKTGKMGFIDKNGREVIPCIYKFADSFQEGLASVLDENDNRFYIDTEGRVTITIPEVYCSTIEINGIKYNLEAETSEELRKKKLSLLDEIKKDLTEAIDCSIATAKQQIEGEKRIEYKPVNPADK